MLKTMTVRVTFAAILAGLSMAAHAIADSSQTDIKTIDIPAGDLRQALLMASEQFGADLVFSPEQVKGFKTGGAHGQLTTEQAVTKLLEGTPLELRIDPSGALLIAPPAAAKGSPRVSTYGEPPKSFWSRLRLAQSDMSVDSRGDSQVHHRTQTAATEQGENAARRSNALELTEVIVTGTHIRGVTDSPSPVYTFDREYFAAAGASSVQQVLRSLPQIFTGGSSETSAAVTSTRNGADLNVNFGAGVNLRGLGTESTLVLLNGRRMAPGGFGNMTDVSTIPLSAIERVEVVPDGASAVYGSDAVGGVVNFVLREDFDGAETRLRYGAVTDGDLTQTNLSQVLGTTWTTGAVLLNLDYARNEPLRSTDRPFATGLQVGETYLSPEDERIGFLVNGRQDLTPNLTLSAVVYGVERDATGHAFYPFEDRQITVDGTTTQFGGTLGLDWHINESWKATLAHTQGRSKNERQNIYAATSALPELRTFVTATHDSDATELEVEGALFALRGGDARLALGAERRTEELSIEQSSGFVNSSYERQVAAGYAELYLPLIGATNASSFARRLSFTLAGRYEDYDDVGSADTYKLGALWSPVEHLNLRATYGTSFRAPYLQQYDSSLSGAMIVDLPDPAAASGFRRTALFFQMPDSDLGPENATIWSAGLDLAPELFGLRLSATYFDIAYEDRITAGRFHFNAFADPSLVDLIAIPPDPALMDLIDEVVQFYNDTPGDLSTVEATFDGRTRNQASTRMTGVDVVIGRDFETEAGAIDVELSLTRLLSHDVQALSGAPVVDILDTIFNPVDLRARASLSWQFGGWSASAFVNYTDTYKDNQLPGTPSKVASWTTVDLGVGYTFRDRQSWLKGTTVRLNAINAFDKDPPRITDQTDSYGDPGYDTENANPIGRLIALEVSKAW